MTYATEKIKSGRELATVIELDLTECSLTYGNAPCTATGSAGDECYNTRKTCQDVANFANTTTTYRFITPIESIPPSIAPAYPAILGDPKFSSSKFDPGGGLGSRATVSIKLTDFAVHDRGIDPYVSTRASAATGTFWGRLKARNPHYIGRTLRVRTGYIADAFSWSDFQDKSYVIERIDGPDKKGELTIYGKDLLKLADDDRIQIPVLSTGSLSANITDVASSLSVNSGEGADYAASGTISIGSEDIIYTRSGDTFTLTTRGANGTTAADHDAGDTVQQCKVYSAVNVVDIIHEILTDYVGISAAKIPYAEGGSPLDDWDDEKADWLSGHNFTRTISKPTGAQTLLNELCAQAQLNVWHDLVNDEIKLKANTPPPGNVAVTDLDDTTNIIEDSIDVKDDQEKRLSQIWVYYNKLDNSKGNDKENFSRVYIQQDATREGVDLYDSARVRTIFANWMTDANAAQAAQLAGRLLARYSDPPKVISFTLDVKDDALSIGDLADISTHKIQDATGATAAHRVQIIEKAESVPGHQNKYQAITSSFIGSYGFIGPNTLNDRDVESDENRQAYAFIAPDSGIFADGDAAYKII